MDELLKKDVRKWALQNAVKYEGRASVGAVVGKLLQEHPELKPEIRELSKEISKIVGEVNKLGKEAQLSELQLVAPELLEKKKEEKRGLKDLPNAEYGKVVMRMAPAPSGPLQIGNAITLCLNSEYCKKYNGKFILRIEDTNPDNIYEPAYRMIVDEAQWLTNNNVAQVVVQSDRLGIYYDYGEKIISMGHAYVCTCNPDVFKDLINNSRPCPCRNLPVKEQLKRWDKMFGEYKPGEAVVRIKTRIDDPNPAMRDWPAFRINDHPHPRKGKEFRVWPLMNFSVAVDDHELGMTHTIRGKDHVDNEKRQKYLFDYFGWKMPTHLYMGRINFTDFEMSKTKTKAKIARGEFSDWDDIRLPFVAPLRRRGYQAEAICRYAVDLGVTLTDKTVSGEDFYKALNAHNKAILDPIANRYFFVDDPVEIEVEGSPEQKVELDLHPDDHDRGQRVLYAKQKFLIANADYKKLKAGKLYRLMDCLNFVKKRGKKMVFDSLDYDKYKDKGEMIMHWLPAEGNIPVEVLMPDNTLRKGFGEPAMKMINEGDVVQLERFGFCRLDKKTEDKLVFWFAHK